MHANFRSKKPISNHFHFVPPSSTGQVSDSIPRLPLQSHVFLRNSRYPLVLRMPPICYLCNNWKGTPYPEVTGSFCLVPSTWLSQAPRFTRVGGVRFNRCSPGQPHPEVVSWYAALVSVPSDLLTIMLPRSCSSCIHGPNGNRARRLSSHQLQNAA